MAATVTKRARTASEEPSVAPEPPMTTDSVVEELIAVGLTHPSADALMATLASLYASRAAFNVPLMAQMAGPCTLEIPINVGLQGAFSYLTIDEPRPSPTYQRLLPPFIAAMEAVPTLPGVRVYAHLEWTAWCVRITKE